MTPRKPSQHNARPDAGHRCPQCFSSAASLASSLFLPASSEASSLFLAPSSAASLASSDFLPASSDASLLSSEALVLFSEDDSGAAVDWRETVRVAVVGVVLELSPQPASSASAKHTPMVAFMARPYSWPLQPANPRKDGTTTPPKTLDKERSLSVGGDPSLRLSRPQDLRLSPVVVLGAPATCSGAFARCVVGTPLPTTIAPADMRTYVRMDDLERALAGGDLPAAVAAAHGRPMELSLALRFLPLVTADPGRL